MHEHYDVIDAGTPDEREVLTGRTVVHRESPWDDRSRQRAMRLAEHQRNVCPCGCGQQVDKAWDKDQVWKVDHYTCYAEKARTQVDRQLEKKHENSPPGWDDGRHSFVIPVDDERPPEVREKAQRRSRRRGGSTDD